MIEQPDPYDAIRRAYQEGAFAAAMHARDPKNFKAPNVEDYINKLMAQPLRAYF